MAIQAAISFPPNRRFEFAKSHEKGWKSLSTTTVEVHELSFSQIKIRLVNLRPKALQF
jgi:hypothetical protein